MSNYPVWVVPHPSHVKYHGPGTRHPWCVDWLVRVIGDKHSFPVGESIAADPALARSLAAAGVDHSGAHGPVRLEGTVEVLVADAEDERRARAPLTVDEPYRK